MVVAVDGGGGAGDQADFARPGEDAAAVCADKSCPAAVVDFAQRCEHLRARVAVHAQDGAEIFHQHDSVIAELLQQPALRRGSSFLLGGTGEQAGLGQNGGQADLLEPGERHQELGLSAAAGCHEQQPRKQSRPLASIFHRLDVQVRFMDFHKICYLVYLKQALTSAQNSI